VGTCAEPRGKQRLRPLEVVRYSNVDEEPRANQPIDPAVEKAGEKTSLSSEMPSLLEGGVQSAFEANKPRR